MVQNPIKMDDLGCFPIIFGNTHINFMKFPNLNSTDSSIVAKGTQEF